MAKVSGEKLVSLYKHHWAEGWDVIVKHAQKIEPDANKSRLNQRLLAVKSTMRSSLIEAGLSEDDADAEILREFPAMRGGRGEAKSAAASLAEQVLARRAAEASADEQAAEGEENETVES